MNPITKKIKFHIYLYKKRSRIKRISRLTENKKTKKLVALLKKSSVEESALIIKSLSEINNKESINALVELISSKSRYDSLEAIAQLKTKKTSNNIKNRIKQREKEILRNSFQNAIGSEVCFYKKGIEDAIKSALEGIPESEEEFKYCKSLLKDEEFIYELKNDIGIVSQTILQQNWEIHVM